eukprot:CAMPEP_0170488168 /NCGR_PEP_ID=MMETSP0208-20121228/6782_1 /TAXON_ID=197538 /ORGANISM="Strombidium inclinatum, Strain S3" /LENGTH=78 /DNA_ID=CAMNT_0010762661 /DNA_START=1288 /DNA_END=1524 /DNA_ORIENTATION=+
MVTDKTRVKNCFFNKVVQGRQISGTYDVKKNRGSLRIEKLDEASEDDGKSNVTIEDMTEEAYMKNRAKYRIDNKNENV